MDAQTPAGLELDESGDLIIPGENTLDEAPADKAGVDETPEQAAAHSEEGESFMPATDVKPGQEKAYKSMQAAFTRKMQELSEKMRGSDDLRKKAELFDQISPVLQDPEFQQVVSAYKEGRRSQEPEDEPEIEPAVKAYLDRKLSSQDEARKFETMKLQRQIELRDLAAAHEDWKDHYAGIVTEIRANPGLSVEKAYQNVKGPVLAQENARLRQELESLKNGKRQGMSVQPGTRTAAATAKQAPPKDFAEAAQRAIAKLNREGYKVE